MRYTKYIIVALVLGLFVYTMYAKYSRPVKSSRSYDTTTQFSDTTGYYPLEYSEYVFSTVYASTDSCLIETVYQGNIGGNWVTLSRDTLAKADSSPEAYTLRNGTSTDNLKGVEQIRMIFNVTPDDDDSSGSYSVNLLTR